MVSFKQDCINLLSRHGKDKNIPAGVLANFIESSLRNLDKVYEDCISKVKMGKTTILHGVKSVTSETTTSLPVILAEVTDDFAIATGQTGELISEKKDLPVVELKVGEELPEGDSLVETLPYKCKSCGEIFEQLGTINFHKSEHGVKCVNCNNGLAFKVEIDKAVADMNKLLNKW